MEARAKEMRFGSLERLEKRLNGSDPWILVSDRNKERRVQRVYRHSFSLYNPCPLSQFFLILSGSESSLACQLKFIGEWRFPETQDLF